MPRHRPPPQHPAIQRRQPAGDIAALAADCTDEGKVNLIALPDEWANYKGILQASATSTPASRTLSPAPDISSKEEMDAVKTLAGQDDMPDNVDVSPAIAQAMVDEGLFEPYKTCVDSRDSRLV